MGLKLDKYGYLTLAGTSKSTTPIMSLYSGEASSLMMKFDIGLLDSSCMITPSIVLTDISVNLKSLWTAITTAENLFHSSIYTSTRTSVVVLASLAVNVDYY
jgi:hypothetical protein